MRSVGGGPVANGLVGGLGGVVGYGAALKRPHGAPGFYPRAPAPDSATGRAYAADVYEGLSNPIVYAAQQYIVNFEENLAGNFAARQSAFARCFASNYLDVPATKKARADIVKALCCAINATPTLTPPPAEALPWIARERALTFGAPGGRHSSPALDRSGGQVQVTDVWLRANPMLALIASQRFLLILTGPKVGKQPIARL